MRYICNWDDDFSDSKCFSYKIFALWYSKTVRHKTTIIETTRSWNNSSDDTVSPAKPAPAKKAPAKKPAAKKAAPKKITDFLSEDSDPEPKKKPVAKKKLLPST